MIEGERGGNRKRPRLDRLGKDNHPNHMYVVDRERKKLEGAQSQRRKKIDRPEGKQNKIPRHSINTYVLGTISEDKEKGIVHERRERKESVHRYRQIRKKEKETPQARLC